MKIVTCEEFIKMPAGAIFAPCDEWGNIDNSEGFEIKVDEPKQSEDGRWSYNGTCPILKHCSYDEWEFFYYDGDSNDARNYKLFAVFEEQDIDDMVKLLTWAKGGCKDYSIIDGLPGF